MAKYVIDVTLDCIYEIEAENEESAIEQAIEWFQECQPEVTVVMAKPNTH